MEKIGLDPHALPKPEHLAGFTGVVCVYGKPLDMSGAILSKQAAEGFLRQYEVHPEKFYITYENAPYLCKRVWLEEEDETSGRVMAEYKRIDEK